MMERVALVALAITRLGACGDNRAADTPGAAGNPQVSDGAGGTAGGAGANVANDPCTPLPCENGGLCAAADGGFTCSCPAGFAGVTCASNIDDCLPNPCLNGGTCVDGVASATCVCAGAFTGSRCELPRFQPILGTGAPCDGPLAATAVSADGSAVVGNCGAQSAFLWTRDGGFVDLGIPSTTTLDSLPFAVNGDGSALLAQLDQRDGTAGIFRWGAGAGLREVLPIPDGAALAAYAASGDLSTIVGTYVDSTLPAGDQLGFLFTAAAGLQELTVPDGSTNGCGAFGVSADGTVLVGACYGSDNVLHVSRWRIQGTEVALDLLDTSANSTFGNAISGDGNVVVGYLLSGSVYHQLRLAGAGPPEDLGTLPAAQTSGAIATNLDGSVIVGSAEKTTYPITDFATVWDAQNGLRAVGDALSAAGVDTLGWTLTSAVAVSADGKTIVGNGANPDYQQRFWIARLY
jgi:uncharacterized membrane protein